MKLYGTTILHTESDTLEVAIFKYKGKYYVDSKECSESYNYYKGFKVLDISELNCDDANKFKWDCSFTIKTKNDNVINITFSYVGNDELSIMELLGNYS